MPSPKSACGTSLCNPDFMEKYKTMTPEIEAIDQEIMRLKGLRATMVAKSAKKKADALCAEMAAKKARR